jgi:hypothetical protein
MGNRRSIKNFRKIKETEDTKGITKRKYKHIFRNIIPYDSDNIKTMKECSRSEARAITGTLTGTALTNDHLHKMGKVNNFLCRFCKKHKETVQHWITDCAELQGSRHFIKSNTKETSFKEWLQFIKHTKIKDTFLRPEPL